MDDLSGIFFNNSTLTRIVPDDSVLLQPFRLVVVQGLVEDEEHGQEVAGQAGVVYQVEHADLYCKGREEIWLLIQNRNEF